MDLEAQLDDLLHRLEEVDPESVPADLRQHKPEEPVVEPVAAEPKEPEVVEAEAVAEPVAAETEAKSEAEAEAEAEMIAQQVATDAVNPEAVVEKSDTGGKEKESAGIGESLDLDALGSMVTDLLDKQIDSKIEAACEPEPEPTPAAGIEEEAKPEAVVAVSEDDLASQIQGLLDDVQAKGVDAVTSKEPEAQAAQDVTEPEPVEPEPVETMAGTEEATSQAESPEDAGAVSIDQIDAMLAESAEQAIEHGPEVEAGVPGTDEVLAAEAKAEQEAEARAQAKRESAEQVVPEPVSETEPEPISATEPQAVEAIGASAADVANELDEEAQAVGVSIPADEAGEPVSAEPVGVDVPEAVIINHSGLKKAEHALLQVCGKINRPLNGLSPEMRDTVGYAGVVTTALAMFMFIYGVLF